MASGMTRSRKPWPLETTETVTSFERWRSNLVYNIRQDECFAPFTTMSWNKFTKKADNKFRGLLDDTDATQPVKTKQKTKDAKLADLELMLEMIANWAPIVSRLSILRNSTSLESVWQAIRAHYGFQTSGAYFLDLADMKLQQGERHQDLYQRLMAFTEDNLLVKDGPLTHHGEKIEEDEDISPSLENVVVLIWLQLIHKDLPKLVKQKYATELRSRTLASIKPEISVALDSLLDEIHSNTNARVLRSGSKFPAKSNNRSNTGPSKAPYHTGPSKAPYQKSFGSNRPSCPICKAKGKPDNHFISKCSYLPERDRRFINKARLVSAIDDVLDVSDGEEPYEETDPADQSESDDDDRPPIVKLVNVDPLTVKRVQVGISPWFNVFHKHQAVKITVDSGAQVNMIRDSVAIQLNAKVRKSSQQAFQADGSSPINVVGEINVTLSRGDLPFKFSALVCKNIDDDIIGGIPFMKDNNIIIDAANDSIVFTDNSKFCYTEPSPLKKGLIRRTQAHVLQSGPNKCTLFPGDFIEISLPSDLSHEKHPIAVEPRPDHTHTEWPSPRLLRPVDGKVRIYNETHETFKIPRKQHFCQAMPSVRMSKVVSSSTVPVTPATQPKNNETSLHSLPITINESTLGPTLTERFTQLHSKYDNVFNPNIQCYNGKAGNIEGVVNMGPILPPQRKGRVPQYSRNRLEELQDKCDELESIGVLAKPEDIPVVAEYLNPSFLVKKPAGGHRLVTAFAEVGSYAKPQPSLMPNVDATLRQIACWKHIITTDLSKAFYQIPLSKDSLKFCGISTPFKGVRVYTRCAMGMPGSETALEELMSRVLGDLIQEGSVAKVADDLYIGAETPELLLAIWERVLEALHTCDIRLAATKTEIAPSTTTILGWTWANGTITATPHRIATLSTCAEPTTVKAMRGFLGAYKFLSRVLPNISSVLAPLEDSVAGRNSPDRIVWTSELHHHFKAAQSHLQKSKTITVPTPQDQLWILTDGAQKIPGLGASLFITRPDGKRLLSGFYSTKLHKRQLDWLPCELEALAISASVSHFAPYIIQSKNRCTILTDSKPCVDAFTKLCKGQFSVSARVTTYLSTVSRYQCEVRHVKGADNTFADFQSRHATPCDTPSCQVCQFVSQLEEAAVRSITVKDILDGSVRVPFSSRSAWRTAQEECPDLRQAKAQLKQGTYPSKKVTNRRDLKRYLQTCSIAKDGLLVVKRSEKYTATVECIVVPRALSHGLATAVHLKFDHPSAHQLKQVMKRAFYAISMDQTIDDISDRCPQCAALRSIPAHLMEQTTECPPYAVGMNFAVDVLKRERQLILILREYVTSYTQAITILSEKHDVLREALLQLVVVLKPADGPPSVIRVDPAPGFQALKNDQLLQEHNIVLEVGMHKNINKNPVAERAIQEFEQEISKLCPNGQVSAVNVALICNRINQKIRYPGLSSKEMITKRDQYSNQPLPVDDIDLITQKHEQHTRNHETSARSKASFPALIPPDIDVGDLVHVTTDLSKGKQRERYLVAKVDGEFCSLRKFTGSQLREAAVRVKKSMCYHVPVLPSPLKPTRGETCDDDSEEVSPPPVITRHQDITMTDVTPTAEFGVEATASPPLTPCRTEMQSPRPILSETTNSTPAMEASAPVLVDESVPREPVTPTEVVAPRRTGRTRHPPVWLGEYEC